MIHLGVPPGEASLYCGEMLYQSYTDHLFLLYFCQKIQ